MRLKYSGATGLNPLWVFLGWFSTTTRTPGVARIDFMSCVQSVNLASGTGLVVLIGNALKWPVLVVTSLPVTAVK